MNATKNDIAFYGNLILANTANIWWWQVGFLILAVMSLYRTFKE